MTDGCQAIAYHAFGTKPLAVQLRLEPPPFAKKRAPFQQLQYVQDYLGYLGCKTVIEEEHYIDRDHIEDHSVFYALNFVSYKNSCRRLHFFSDDENEVRQNLKTLVGIGQKDQSEYRRACKEFSQKAYLGSVVIKPLDGCPVGRTILRPYPRQEKGALYVRDFPCVRPHRAHLLGVELTVEGLPFQQQDTGVSACATTAIWCALHHLKGMEDVASATPAQITSAASKYSLPFGRPMPSEGLSMEQMCQAIQSIGVSPHLYRADDFDAARSIIYSATLSGMASILIIQRDGSMERHAVAVAGIKLHEPFTPTAYMGIADRAARLMGIYIHDDRWGPYVSTLFEKNAAGRGQLRFQVRGAIKKEEIWLVTHILIPMHLKIRLSFGGLNEVAMEIVRGTREFFHTQLNLATPDITFSTSIQRGYKYVEELLFEKNGLGPDKVQEFASKVSLPRYIGLVRIENPLIGIIDVLVDTTGTLRNLHCSAVFCRGPKTAQAAAAGNFLAKHFNAFPQAFGS